nr:unnamed protein product [Callosobruchus analis]
MDGQLYQSTDTSYSKVVVKRNDAQSGASKGVDLSTNNKLKQLRETQGRIMNSVLSLNSDLQNEPVRAEAANCVNIANDQLKTKDSLKILHHNVQCLTTAFSELEHMVANYQPHFLRVTEYWLTSETISLFVPQGYKLVQVHVGVLENMEVQLFTLV